MILSDQLYKTYSISSPPKKGGMGSVVAPYGAKGFGEVTPKRANTWWQRRHNCKIKSFYFLNMLFNCDLPIAIQQVTAMLIL